MGDEFAKGFGILVTAGFLWMVLAGWYNTPGFEEAQLTGPNPSPEAVGTYGQIALIFKDVLFWLAIFGALTFWVIIPLVEEARTARAE